MLNDPSISHLIRLQPQQLETRLALLIRHFLDSRSPTLAKIAAEHIDALLAHPDFEVPFKQRCTYRRLSAHWRCLAWIDSYPVAAEKASKMRCLFRDRPQDR